MQVADPTIIACDVLIIGGGVAATTAARMLAGQNLKVWLACTGSLGSVGIRGAGASSCGTTFFGMPRVKGIEDPHYRPDNIYNKIIAAGTETTYYLTLCLCVSVATPGKFLETQTFYLQWKKP